MGRFLTIRQAVKDPECPVGESFLRQMVAQGRCPGVYSGTRFLVNFPALVEQLDRESREAVKG